MAASVGKLVRRVAPRIERVLVLGCSRLPRGGICCATGLDRLKNHRRLHKQRDDEDNRADEQNEDLHWDLHDGVEQKTETALRDGFAGEIALHLTLIAAKIG